MADKVIPIHNAARPAPPAPRYDGSPLADTLGRTMRDLRISVTDRCNFRCVYCMPREVFDADYEFLPHGALLSFEEIARLARVFVGLGVKKIRLTGGEPLLRKDLPTLVAMLAPLGADLTLTTNGSTLVKHARALRAAGLNRVTVSLDSLDEATFRAMNDADFPVEKVLDGIAAAADAGFAPIKINMVVKRGVNDHQIVEAARHWRDSGNILRFIEYMDVGSTNGWRMDHVLPSAELIEHLDATFPLEPLDAQVPGETAQRWRYLDGGGEIGVISSVTQAFCRDCNRARLSTEGRLYLCLFATHGHDLRHLLRDAGASDAELIGAIADIWSGRADRYSELRSRGMAAAGSGERKVEMHYIGG
jgi:cyclic pyranopterin phosphate synthase